MKTVAPLLLLAACCAGACAQASRNDIAALTTENFTQPSPGKWVSGGNNGIKVTQTMISDWGSAIEYRHWFRQRDAASLIYATTPETSKFWFPGGSIFTWPVRRHEFDVLWSHKLAAHNSPRWFPYSIAGVGAIALWGGSGRISSGADRQFPFIAGVGSDIRLSRRFTLRVEATADIMKQSTFSDETYRSTWTVMAGPKVGFVYALGARKAKPL